MFKFEVQARSSSSIAKFKFEVQVRSSSSKFKFEVQAQSSKFKVRSSSSKFKFEVQVRSSSSMFKFEVQVRSSSSKFKFEFEVVERMLERRTTRRGSSRWEYGILRSGDILWNGCWNVGLGTIRRGSWEYSTTVDKA
jgi:hypothetical protein